MPDSAHFTVVFTPSGKRGRFAAGTSVLAAARELGVDIDSVCGGRGLCGRCQGIPVDGELLKLGFSSSPDHVSAANKVETRYARIHGELKPGRRLTCQALIEGDVVIDVPPDSQVHRQVVRKEVEHVSVRVNPAVRLYMVQVREPYMHEPSSDLSRLLEALRNEWQLDNLLFDNALLPTLQTALRKGEWQVTVAVHDPVGDEPSPSGYTSEKRIIGIWPNFHDASYGVAIDIGSTTIAAHLCNLLSGDVVASSGCMNPQIRFGEDVMSRVSYVMMNPGGHVQLTTAVREAIDALLADVAREAEIDSHHILDLALVANPIMHHLLLGIDPTELGQAPFALATDGAVHLSAQELRLNNIHAGARAYVLPCIAGHVGADTAGVVLAEQPDALDAISLLVDVGTNAEIVLGNRHRLLACSSPTGPAFEGAQISGGQRAAPGAIERVRIDPQTFEPRFRIIGAEAWSDEADFDTQSAGLGVTGICGSGIIEVVAEMFLAGIIDSNGVIRGELAARSSRIVEDGRTHAYLLHQGEVTIRISQNDVRQIQLAKAALYAGVRLLMDKLGIEAVERIRLAGAFGSHIDVKYAMVLGLVPDCALDQVSSAGNAAGTGARLALLDIAAREHIESVVRQIEKIETAIEPDFQMHFVNAMAIPNKVDRFVQLEQVVTLPQVVVAEEAGGRRRRRRREP